MATPLCSRSQSLASNLSSPSSATTSTLRFLQACAQLLLLAFLSPPRFQRRADHHYTITLPPPVHEPVFSSPSSILAMAAPASTF
ncbi:hypothetical protein M0R45_025799 [Rubus argutus]|uniref:Uncharacterized protein n=1 Tax=Rubus argutus TaxID=59490 RepID=A0AAW1WY38_RUBAR